MQSSMRFERERIGKAVFPEGYVSTVLLRDIFPEFDGDTESENAIETILVDTRGGEKRTLSRYSSGHIPDDVVAPNEMRDLGHRVHTSVLLCMAAEGLEKAVPHVADAYDDTFEDAWSKMDDAEDEEDMN